MGKKHQQDREARRAKYEAKRQSQSNKNKLIGIGIGAVVVAIVAYAGFTFATMTANAPGAPPGAGLLNDDHVHAGMLVKIFQRPFDFSLPSYQTQTAWIHFEGGNGDTIHRHASGVTLGYMFESMDITLTDECYVFPDGREFCTNDTYELKFYINGERVPSITEYVVQEDDRILISFGDEDEDEIQNQLNEIESTLLDR